MAIFMARGYKDPFHRHVSQSLGNYFSEQRREELQSAVRAHSEDGQVNFDSDRLLELLEKETVTAWGAKEKDVNLFRQISPGDSFLMRTGRPAIVQYVQQIDYTLGGEAPRDLRAKLSETIWGSDDYEYLWFSETPITEIELPQKEFESIIREAHEEFDFDDWFPYQSTNATRIDEEVLADLGGERAFLDRLEEYNGEELEPDASQHFLFYEAHDAAGLTDDHFFEFKQTAVEHWSEVRDAENDGRAAVLDDEGCIVGVGRIGNIEGEQRDGSRYKKVNLIDWQPVSADSLTDFLEDLPISFQRSAVEPHHPRPDLITLLSEDDFEAILEPVSEAQSTNISPPESLPGMLPSSEGEPDDATKLANQLERNGQLVLYGPPGTGKTYTATRFARWWIHQQEDRPSDQRFQTVTFHPSYSYEDFMEGLTANATDENLVEYEYEDGTFKEIVKQARNDYLEAADRDSAPRYVLLIDEINRGNLSQIFGEAITQLEMDKRLDQDESVTVRWAHTGDPIDIPPNLYLIGTMNTADQSIAQVDAALRRRFAFVGCPPDYSVFVDEYEFDSETAIESMANEVIESGREGVDIAEDHYSLLALSIRALKAINENILSSRDLNKGKQIGHSYLLNINSTDDLVAAWQFDILPLLEEYYFGDFDRLRREVFEIDVETSSETVIDSNLFELNEHKIADLEADDLETALGQFVDSHEFNAQ